MLIFSIIFNVNVLKTYYFKEKTYFFLKNLLFTLQYAPTNSNYFRKIYLLFSITLVISDYQRQQINLKINCLY